MRFHTIHFPAIKTCSLGADKIPLGYQIENILVVKEGFCWPAFLFTMLWAIWQRLWLVAAGLLSISLITIFILDRLGADQSVILIIYFGITMVFGYHANDFRRTKLKQIGYLERGVVCGVTEDAAVWRYLTAWLGGR